MGQAALSNEKQPAPFFVSIQIPLPKAAAPTQSGSPSPALPTGRELIPAVFEAVGSSSFPLDKVGMELRTKAMYGWLIVDGVHPDNAGEVALSLRRNSQMVCASSSNSEGVAISQARVEVRSASTLGKIEKEYSNAVSVALSRRRYPHPLNASVITADNPHHDSHRHGFLCFHSSNDNKPPNLLFYANNHTFCPKSVEV